MTRLARYLVFTLLFLISIAGQAQIWSIGPRIRQTNFSHTLPGIDYSGTAQGFGFSYEKFYTDHFSLQTGMSYFGSYPIKGTSRVKGYSTLINCNWAFNALIEKTVMLSFVTGFAYSHDFTSVLGLAHSELHFLYGTRLKCRINKVYSVGADLNFLHGLSPAYIGEGSRDNAANRSYNILYSFNFSIRI